MSEVNDGTDDAPVGERTALASLGWSPFYSNQLEADQTALAPCRISSVHRGRVSGISEAGLTDVILPVHANTGDFAVGDWVLVDRQTQTVRRRLTRKTLLDRGGEGKARQLSAANVDTLLIVTSCNADFNAARLERYLVVANEAGINPVVVLTKADTIPDATDFRNHAAALQRGLAVVALDARSKNVSAALAAWCRPGQTIAAVGSSGVGKSTLVNTLSGSELEARQTTAGVREDDAKGRHTTTSRSLHAVVGGGWIIDTPGIRSLRMDDAAHGIDTLFAEISELAPFCRFRNCTHSHEPGCKVQEGVAQGTLSADRIARWQKLTAESSGNKRARGHARR